MAVCVCVGGGGGRLGRADSLENGGNEGLRVHTPFCHWKRLCLPVPPQSPTLPPNHTNTHH